MLSHRILPIPALRRTFVRLLHLLLIVSLLLSNLAFVPARRAAPPAEGVRSPSLAASQAGQPSFAETNSDDPYPAPGDEPLPLPESPATPPVTSPIPDADSTPLTASLELAVTQAIDPRGGQVTGLGGQVTVIFPPGAVDQDIRVTVQPADKDRLPTGSLSSQPFEIVAQGQADGAPITQFLQPLTIQVQYDPRRLHARPENLSLYYYAETLSEWLPLPSRVDLQQGLLTAYSDHLTVFDYQADDWQATELPSLASFQVSSFTGAAAYSYPFWTPPGPAGLQPSLSLSYTSASADGASAHTQAEWVGLGWSLGVGAIERNLHGTNDYLDDDTYAIQAGGVSSQLLPVADPSAPSGVQVYRLADENHWRVWAHLDSHGPQWWEAWDPSGTRYVFGEDEYDRVDYAAFTYIDNQCDSSGHQTWQWGLSRVQNIYGQSLVYDYTLQYHTVWDKCHSGQVLNMDAALYPRSILYPHGQYQVYFELAPRYDYDDDWPGREAYLFYQEYRLASLQVRHGSDNNQDGVLDGLVKKYAFTYAASGQTHLLPGLTWAAGDQTLTLLSVQEYGLNGSLARPATSFTYDDLHLVEADNGLGGRIAFTYAPWYEPFNNPEQDIFQDFGAWRQACSPNHENDTGGWQPRDSNSQVSCSGYHLAIQGEAYLDIAEASLIQPGGYYTMTVKTSSGSALVGLSDGVSSWYGSGVQGQFQLPSDAGQAQLLVKCTNGCSLDWQRYSPLTAHYRVVEKRLYDGQNANPAIFSYRYDEPAVNDPAHSAAAGGGSPYTPPYTEFRGHALVQEVGPDGRVTSQYYAQNDVFKGQAQVSLVTQPSYWEPFESTNLNNYSSNWSFSAPGSQQTVARLAGDNALKLSNANADWLSSLLRTSYSLSDGKLVLLQVRLAGGSVRALSSLENASDGRRWEVYFHDGLAEVQYNQSGSWATAPLLSGIQNDRWYVVLLAVDNQQFVARLWERDRPQVLGEFTHAMPANLNWRFRQRVYNGTAWLDEYNEGQLYSMSQHLAVYSVPQAVDPLPENSAGYPFTDLEIRWTRPVTDTLMSFNTDGQWVGQRTVSQYLASDQGGTQYGNRTRTLESYWTGSAWQSYRGTRAGFYPTTDSTHYLVGLPGFANQYACPGSCDWQAADLLGSTWYLYDGSTSYSAPPTTGILSGQRTKLRFAGTGYSDSRYADVSYTYDAWGNRLTETRYTGEGTDSALSNQGGQTTTHIYDAIYHTYLLQTANPLNQVTILTYDYLLGVPLTETGPNGAATLIQAEYDSFGRVIKVIRPGDSSQAPSVAISYQESSPPFGTVFQQKIDATTSRAVRKYYDGLGRLIQQQQAGAALADDACSSDADVLPDTCDIVTDTSYDAYGQVVRQSVPYAVTLGSGYRTPDLSQPATQTTYDPLGRPLTVTAPDGTQQTNTYADGYNNNLYDPYPYQQTCTQDGLGRTTCTQNDLWGNVRKVTPPSGPVVEYDYEAFGRLTNVTRGGATTSLSYDVAGRKVQMVDPDLGTWSYAYDALGNLLTQTDARGCVSVLAYDNLNRLTGKTYGGPGACGSTPGVSYSYDAYDPTSGQYGIGYRTGMTDAAGTAGWKYDTRGRTSQASRSVNTVGTFVTQWSYNSADLPETMTYPADNTGALGETVSYTYLPQGSLKALFSNTYSTYYVQNVTYDAAGRMDVRSLGANTLVENPALITHYDYFDWDLANGQGRLKSIQTGTPANPTLFQDLRYYSGASGSPTPAYNAVGDLLNIYDYKLGNPQTQAFTYDTLDRLVSAQASGGTGGNYSLESYAYDTVTGNLSSKAGVSYAYNTTHKHAVASTSDGRSFQYDANGNQTQRVVGGLSYNLAYDAENHLTGVTGAANASFTYDGDGQRIAGTVGGITTIYIGGYFEWTGSTSTMKRYYAAGSKVAMRTGSDLSWLLSDHLGSTTVTVNASLVRSGELAYKAWGENRYTYGSTPTTSRYTGQREEASLGIYYYGARWYDPALGRFIQPDTIIPEVAQGTQAWDRYAYTNNTPVQYNDPSGHCILCIVIGAVAGAAVGYATQVYNNFQNNGGNLEKALTTNISADPILAGAVTGATIGLGVGIVSTLASGAAAAAGGSTIGTSLASSRLQSLTNSANNELSANPALAQDVLTQSEYVAGQNSARVALMQYGNAVERIVADKIQGSRIDSQFFEHVGGPSNPDFIGKGILNGLNFDITTPGQITSHLARSYGPGLNITTYIRPPDFTVFP